MNVEAKLDIEQLQYRNAELEQQLHAQEEKLLAKVNRAGHLLP